MGSGTLSFDENGNLISGDTGTTTSGALTWANSSDQTQLIIYSFDTT
jgi:hypothetical protein